MTKILLVEDDKSLREIYGVRLLAEGYDIVSAGDGEEALAMAIKERPQLIVSDVMMPKISGFDMLDILRSTTETKDIKVIMMTALSSEDQRIRGEQLGADRYLVKSQVGIEDVVRTVHDVLGDIPSATPTAQQTFGTPAPSAAPRPAAPAVPPRPTEIPPAPAPVIPQPIAPTPPAPAPQPAPAAPQPAVLQPSPAPAPQPQPTAPQSAPTLITPPAPDPTDGQLPQPTAPFSGQRPASLGERVIHPIEDPAPTSDVASLIAQELGDPSAVPAPPAPPMPEMPPAAPNQFQDPPAPGQ
ncbi:MAG TPA: response regulator [Candidatus Saccharibacteria bacterium]|nr:response regulator [Candidatus Saccharibacteria bacterium]